jgi:hypothetical protein
MIKISSIKRKKKYKKNLFSRKQKLQFYHFYNTATVKKLAKFTIILFL